MEGHNIESDEYGNLEFKALVEYASSVKNVTDATEVSIKRNGYNDGAIGLGETDRLSATHFHLDFTINYQKYRFSKEDGKLTITGTSFKMGGSYSVTLLPV